jgi:DNA-damage-inducible protein D
MNIFDNIKRIDPDGQEYWSSRDLAKALEYVDYRNFEEVIAKARIACKNSRQPEEDHFVDVNEMVPLGSGAERQIPSVFLSRYACYLIIQSADPKKEVVALGHSYFAMQTRRQEVEDDRRLQLRQEMKEHNKELASAAKQAGVVEPIDYAIFQNFGYQGLYGGLRKQDIHQRKGLKKSQDILDHMGSEELAANLFRATQTEAKLRRDGISNKGSANKTHYDVGKKIRDTIAEFGNIMPENLPTPDQSIKQLETKKRKELKRSIESTGQTHREKGRGCI